MGNLNTLKKGLLYVQGASMYINTLPFDYRLYYCFKAIMANRLCVARAFITSNSYVAFQPMEGLCIAGKAI